MATLREIAREMISRSELVLGRMFTVTSLTTTTVVCSSQATGGDSSQKYEGQFMIRRDAASAADRKRRCAGTASAVGFASATGTWTHAGTNYSDTTVGSPAELLELSEFEPELIDEAIQIALARLKRRDVQRLPLRASDRLSLHDLDWIEEPNDVMAVGYTSRPVLTRNGNLEKWNTVSTAGALQPDAWTFSGSGATLARGTTGNYQGRYVAEMTRSGTNCFLTQEFGILWNGASLDSLRGRDITVFGIVRPDAASQVRLQILEDGVVVASSDYNTGTGKNEELSKSYTVTETCDTLSVRVAVEVDGTVRVERADAVYASALDDTIRKDLYEDSITWRKPDWEQSGTLILKVPPEHRGLGRTVHIASKRPYSKFDNARVVAGSADGDSTDAPKLAVAIVAIHRVFEFYAGLYEHRDNSKYAALRDAWGPKADAAIAAHLHVTEPDKSGADLPKPVYNPVVRRW